MPFPRASRFFVTYEGKERWVKNIVLFLQVQMGMRAQRIHIHLLRVNLHYAVRHSISQYWTALSDAASGDSLGPFSRENVFCKSVKMNLCVATAVAEFKHSGGKLLSIYFVLSESLPFFTDGDFSILHFFFFCLLPHFLSIPAFVRNLFCVWKWLKCPSSNFNVLTKYCSSLLDPVAVIQSVETLTLLWKPKFRYLI